MIDNNILAQLNEVYNKTSLEKGLFPFVKNFYQELLLVVEIDPDIIIIFEKIAAKKLITKPELLLLCFSVFENETIFKRFLLTLPNYIQILLEKLLWIEEMSEPEIEPFIGLTITVPSKYAYSSSFNDVKNEYLIFSVKKRLTHSYPEKGYYILSISTYLKQILVRYYPKPAHYNFLPTGEVPATPYSFNAENLIINELPKVLSYYMQQGIKYSTSGKPLEGTLNKFQRSCSISEFELTSGDELGKIRSNLIAGMLYNFKVDNISIDTVSIIKELFTNRYLKLQSVQFILMQLKGWGYMDNSGYDYIPYIERTFLDIINLLPPGEWISYKNLIEFIECRFIYVQPVTSSALSYRLYYQGTFDGTTEFRYENKIYVGSRNNALVYQPFIKGTIFLYAAFGLIEIGYDEIDTTQYGKTYFSAYDGLQYFKLTPLGSYVFGKTATYESEFSQQKNKLQLSEDSLMILAEGEMGVLDVMLANFAEKSGTNRYRVTHAHFLKNCVKAPDIDKKITLFTQTISTKLPTYWLQQFEIWKSNAAKIKVDNSTKIFKIPESDKELQKIIAQDPILKALILKAEQFNILVPVANVLKFKARMRELGYLIE